MYLAQSKAAAGQLSEAVSFYNKAIAMGGNSTDINYTIAALYQSSGSFSEAVDTPRKHLLQDRGGPKHTSLLVACMRALGLDVEREQGGIAKSLCGLQLMSGIKLEVIRRHRA